MSAIFYLIDTVLKRNLVNLIYGPSGANKTTWVLDMLRALVSGQPFLGEFPVNAPCPTAHYIALDRPLDEFNQKLLNYPELEGKFTYESLFPRLREFNCIEKVLATVPENVELVVLDGIGFVVEGKKLIEQRAIGILLSDAYAWAQKRGVTVIIIHHTAKSKAGAGYSNHREKAAGSGAWAQCASTSVSMAPISDNIEDPKRVAAVMRNDDKGRLLNLTMTTNGLRLGDIEEEIEVERPEVTTIRDLITVVFSDRSELRKDELLEAGLSEQQIRTAKSRNIIEPVPNAYGYYRVPLKN